MLAAATRELVVLATDGVMERITPGTRLPLGGALADTALIEGGPEAANVIESPLRRPGVRALLRAPLLVAGRVTGVVDAASAQAERFAAKDLRLLRLVADRLSLAIDHVRLRGMTQRLVDRADRAERRWAFVLQAGEVVHTARDIRTGLDALCRRAVLGFADWCAIDLLSGTGAVVRAAMAHRDPDGLAAARALAAQYPVVDGPGRVLSTRRLQFIRRLDDPDGRGTAGNEGQERMLRALGLSSAIVVPAVAGDRAFGALSFARERGSLSYDHRDVATAEQVARYLAVALARAHADSVAGGRHRLISGTREGPGRQGDPAGAARAPASGEGPR